MLKENTEAQVSETGFMKVAEVARDETVDVQMDGLGLERTRSKILRFARR